jgi:hypothetical protein
LYCIGWVFFLLLLLLLLSLASVLGMKPRALLHKHSTTKLYHQPHEVPAY